MSDEGPTAPVFFRPATPKKVKPVPFPEDQPQVQTVVDLQPQQAYTANPYRVFGECYRLISTVDPTKRYELVAALFESFR